MSETSSNQDIAESHLGDLISKDPNDWESRKKLSQLLYNEGKTQQAAEVIWEAPEIPSIDLELGFAIKILGKGAPKKAIRLLSGILELNQGKAVQNLGLANALLHYGMVMQAARFYGAALAADPSLASSDLEHFLLWIDDKEKLWGDFEKDKPNLAELPWMKRDAKEAENLKKAMRGHTTPVKIPNLSEVTAETVVHDMYVQSSRPGTQPTPPPAVTIPMDRVDPKDIIVDPERGAGEPISASQATEAMGPLGGSTGAPLPPVAPASTPVPGAPKPLMTPGLAKPDAPTTPTKPLPPLAPATQPATSGPRPLVAPGLATPPVAAPSTPPATPTQPLTPATPPTPGKLLTPAATGTNNPGQSPAPVPPAAPTTPISPGAPLKPPSTPSETMPMATPGLSTPASQDATPNQPLTPPKPTTPIETSPPEQSASPATPKKPLPPMTPSAGSTDDAAAPPATPLASSSTPITPTSSGNNESTPKTGAEIAQAPKIAPTQITSEGKIVPNPMATQALGGDTPAPVLKPIRTSTLVDGKIVINRPATNEDGDK